MGGKGSINPIYPAITQSYNHTIPCIPQSQKALKNMSLFHIPPNPTEKAKKPLLYISTLYKETYVRKRGKFNTRPIVRQMSWNPLIKLPNLAPFSTPYESPLPLPLAIQPPLPGCLAKPGDFQPPHSMRFLGHTQGLICNHAITQS